MSRAFDASPTSLPPPPPLCSEAVDAEPCRRPDFDSPSVFCRLLDKDKGGFFSISPRDNLSCATKQQYLPSSSILQTRSIHEDGVVDLVDFFPRPRSARVMTRDSKQGSYREATKVQEELKKWLVRRVECIRGSLTLGMA